MTDCDLCGLHDAVHRLPQRGQSDLAICDDCAVGRREEIVEHGHLLATDVEAAVENIRDLRGRYMEKRQAAIREGDETGAAYFSGQVSGLIHAEEAIIDLALTDRSEAPTDG